MKVRALSIIFLGVLAAAPAAAQIVVTTGGSSARDCYMAAKSGVAPIVGLSDCDKALTQDTLLTRDRAGTYVNRGVIEVAMRENDKAMADYASAIQTDPSLGDAYVNRGSLLISMQNYSEALEQINKGLDIGMSFPHIGYYDRAIAEEMMGQYKEAYYDYKKVLEIDPNFTKASDELKYFTVITKPAAADKPS